MKYRQSLGEKLFDAANYVVLILAGIITAYPFIWVLSASLSSENALARQLIVLWPVGFTLDSYRLVFSTDEVLQAYGNTLFYTGVGTLLNVLLTTCAAYPLSRKGYSARSAVMVFITITMFFSGGLVPFYLLVSRLGMVNHRSSIIIPGAVSAWNLMIARVFFQSTIPDELTDAAKIDGANDVTIFFRIVAPLSTPIVAVLSLFYGVAHWNDFFGPLIFLSGKPALHPLSLYLRKVLTLAQVYGGQVQSGSETMRAWAAMALTERMKYATVIVALLPIMLSYPFVQRYFVKGIMLGSLKE